MSITDGCPDRIASQPVNLDEAELSKLAAQLAERIQPLSLTLVLPGDLDKDEILKGLTQAIGQVRSALAQRAAVFQQIAEECAANGGHELHLAACHAQALVTDEAAAAIDESIVEAFGLWDEYEAQLNLRPEAHHS